MSMTQENKTDLQKWQSANFPNACRFVYDEASRSFEYLSEDSVDDSFICFVVHSDSSDDEDDEQSHRFVHFSQAYICSEEEDGGSDTTSSFIYVDQPEFEQKENKEDENDCEDSETAIPLNNNSCCCIIV